MAAGARSVLREAGHRRVVDTDERHVVGDPPLTSVRQPIEEMGRRMARALLQEITGVDPEPCRVVLPTELVVRDST
jgi:DNA-binding LacI/PurR family transcriptional regulator